MNDKVINNQTYYMHPLFFDDPLRKINFNRDEWNTKGAFVQMRHGAELLEDGKIQFNFYLEGELCNYWLRLITRKGDYNIYLTAYAKEKTK